MAHDVPPSQYIYAETLAKAATLFLISFGNMFPCGIFFFIITFIGNRVTYLKLFVFFEKQMHLELWFSLGKQLFISLPLKSGFSVAYIAHSR